MFNFTIPGWTKEEAYTAALHYEMVPWVARAGTGMKRIRSMFLCLLYYELEIGEEYHVEEIAYIMRERDAGGPTSQNLTAQRLGYFLSLFMRKGLVKRERRNGKSYYTRLI